MSRSSNSNCTADGSIAKSQSVKTKNVSLVKEAVLRRRLESVPSLCLFSPKLLSAGLADVTIQMSLLGFLVVVAAAAADKIGDALGRIHERYYLSIRPPSFITLNLSNGSKSEVGRGKK